MEVKDETMNQERGRFQERRSLPNATATLVLGILSIVFSIFGLIMGIIALVLHQKDSKLYNKNPHIYAHSFRSAKAGYVCAIIGTAIASWKIILYLFPFLRSQINHFY